MRHIWRSRLHPGRSQRDIAPAEWRPPLPATVFSRELELSVAGIPLRLIHTPGHTVDHTALYLPQGKILWAGDMLSDLELPLVEDVRAYEATLAELAALDVDILVPGHGAVAFEAADIVPALTRIASTCSSSASAYKALWHRGVIAHKRWRPVFIFPFLNRIIIPNAHLWNIESAYRTLGGTVESPAGWENEWQSGF